jgi:hypothetical protein
MLIGSISCALMAQSKNRNVGGWLMLGALFPLVSIIALACSPARPEPELLR